MVRIFATMLLLVAFALGAQAQERGAWASARERGLKGAVRTVSDTCSDVKAKFETRYKYEFARNGELIVITGPQLPRYDCIIAFPVSYKITKRNSRGDVEEVAILLEGDVIEKERYEYEYDSAGNWIKQVTSRMRTYEVEGDEWKAGEWRAFYVCTQTIEYYP
jgi:hypothetical protein